MPRHRHILLLPFVLAMALLFAAGCGDDPTEPSPTDNGTTGTMQAEFSAAGGDFEIDTNPSGDPNSPLPGPFRIRGTNIHYDDDLGALVVDLTIENRSQRHLPYPVTMTFLGLFPEGVRVLNADNGETGPGAQIRFQFVEDDLTWDPGEVSIPRTVQFATDPGTAVGFVARVDVGLDPSAGAIGGVVFHDRNQNGTMDTDEEGIRDAVLVLAGPDDLLRRTHSLRDGSYRFENLRAGAYTVRKLPMDGTMPTTPSELVIILPQTDDGVADFLSANFGCVRVGPPPGEHLIQPGDILRVKGRYQPDPHRIMALSITVHRPQPNEFPEVHPLLAGPVTALARDRHALAIAGTWMHVDELADPALSPDGECSFENTEVGDRRVAGDIHFVRGEPNDNIFLVTGRFDCWEHEMDVLEGVAETVELAPDSTGRVRFRVRVLNTWVVVTSETEIFFDEPPVPPPPYPLATTPDILIENFLRAYGERDFAAYEAMLHEDFLFYLSAEDVAAGADATFSRARDLEATHNMFRGMPGTTPDGQVQPPIQTLNVRLWPDGLEWTDQVAQDFVGTLMRRYEADMTVEFADAQVSSATGLQEFYAIGVPHDNGDGTMTTLYELKFWRDLGREGFRSATESMSWGGVKLLFAP